MKTHLHFGCRLCLLGTFVFSLSMAAQAHYGRKIKIDPDGNVIVAGDAHDRTTREDILTIKYSGTGVALWTNRYNGPGNSQDNIGALAVGNNGNVFVTGCSLAGTNRDYVTLAYSAAGVALWTNRYNAPGYSEIPARAGLAVDHNGNVFMTGYSFDPSRSVRYLTIAYSAAGVPLWTNTHPGAASDAAVDRSGNVFVTGSSTIAYTGAGVPIWTNRCDVGRPMAMALDTNGNVFVTALGFATVAYSGAGVALWTNRFDGPGDAADVAVDDRGNVFVTGYTQNAVSLAGGDPRDYATVAYSPTGVPLWTRFYGGPNDSYDVAYGVAADNSGNVFVTGTSAGDYVTIKYSGAGVALWTNRFDGPGINSPDGAFDAAVDSSGNVFVTGASGSDCATVAYSAVGVALWTNRYSMGPRLAIQPLTNGLSAVNLKLSGTPNSTWSVERALMITGPWTNLGSSLIGTDSRGIFLDAEPPPNGAFYRATSP